MSIFDDDLDVFFEDGEDAEITNGKYIRRTFKVLFDENGKEEKAGTSGNITAYGPVIRVKTSDVDSYELAKDVTLKIENRNWVIVSPGRMDSPGIRILKLQER